MYEKIKDFCDKQGITIEQFEKAIGVSAGYIYRLKDHQPGYKIARKLSVLLGMSLEEVHELCKLENKD